MGADSGRFRNRAFDRHRVASRMSGSNLQSDLRTGRYPPPMESSPSARNDDMIARHAARSAGPSSNRNSESPTANRAADSPAAVSLHRLGRGEQRLRRRAIASLMQRIGMGRAHCKALERIPLRSAWATLAAPSCAAAPMRPRVSSSSLRLPAQMAAALEFSCSHILRGRPASAPPPPAAAPGRAGGRRLHSTAKPDRAATAPATNGSRTFRKNRRQRQDQA